MSEAKHPLLATLHRELGVSRIEPRPFIIAGKRWLIRPGGFCDAVWAASKRGRIPNDDLIIYASGAAIAVAAVGELKTEVVRQKRPVILPDGTPKLDEKGEVIQEEFDDVVPLPKEQQPAMVPLIHLYPAALSPSIALSVSAGLQAAPTPPGDLLDPPNPWREMAAEGLFQDLLVWAPNVARDLFSASEEVQSEVEVPQLPLPPPSQRVTTS